MSSKRKCVFCDNPASSNEHIFAQWLLNELDIYGQEVYMTHSSYIGIPISHRHHPFSKLVNGLVCEACNNGWMSQLEDCCKSHIINLMTMDELEKELVFLSDHYQTIAKWAFKNAIMLNSATNYRKLVPDEHFKSLKSGKIPYGVFIDLAFCRSSTQIIWRQSQNTMILKDKKIPFNPNSNKYNISYQIGKLLIKVTYYESNNTVLYDNEGALRISPIFGIDGSLKYFTSIDEYNINGVLHEVLNNHGQ